MKLNTKWFQMATVVVVMTLFINSGPRHILEANYDLLRRQLHLGPSRDSALTGARFDELLQELYQSISSADPDIEEILNLRSALAGEHKRVMANFEQQEKLLRKQDVGGELFARLEESHSLYLSRYGSLVTHLDGIAAAGREANGVWAQITGQTSALAWDGLLEPTADFLENYLPPGRISRFDPYHLPHRSLRPGEPIPPKLTSEEWAAAFPPTDERPGTRVSKLADLPASSPTSHLVPKQQLSRANGMTQIGRAAARLAAPALAGVLVVTIQAPGVMLIDGATFLFALISLLLVRIPSHRTSTPDKKRSLRRELADGWAYLVDRPGLLALIGFFAITNLLVNTVAVLVTPAVLIIADAQVLGVVISAGGVGMLAGSLLLIAWGGFKRRIYTVLGFVATLGIALVIAGLRPSPYHFAAGAFLA